MSAVATRSALRRLIRAKNAAFRGDSEMLAIAQQTIREQFCENRGAPAEKVPELLEQLEEAIGFLSNNIVQAPLNDRGNYAVDAARVNDPRKR